MSTDYINDYKTRGYAIIRGLFGPDDIRMLADAFDQVYAKALDHPKSWRNKNVFFRIARDAGLGRIVRFAQWPSYFDDTLNAFRTDRRMFEILSPMIGGDIKQIINQMHWKPPGAAMTDFAYHQDIRFRRPREAYRRPDLSYVQTGIAVDPHTVESGAMTVYPGSHKLGELPIHYGEAVARRERRADDLAALGLDPDAVVTLTLEPGDVAMWHPYLLHGSGPNRSGRDRRLYINGYVRAADCDRGEWTFRDGRPCPLGEPVLVHYEDLHTRPEPHYVEDD